MTNIFVKKVIKNFKQAGLEHLLNKQLSEQDIIKDELNNLFSLSSYDYADTICKSIKWILRHLSKINKTFQERPITKDQIELCVALVPNKQEQIPPNLTVMTNIFSKNFSFYHIDKDEIVGEEITKKDLRAAKKIKTDYKIVHDKETDNDFVYKKEYVKSLKFLEHPDTKKALAGIITHVSDNNKCIAFIESYDKEFETKLIAEKAASNAINAAINHQIVALCIMSMIVRNNMHMTTMNRTITMRRF